MKTCPACRKTYEDDSLVFCLDDGTRLVREGPDANATWNLPVPGPTVASPRPTHPTAQSTMTSLPEQFQRAPGHVGAGDARDESRRSALPWVFAIVLVLGASGVLMAWFMTRGRANDTSSKSPAPTSAPSVIAAPSPETTTETARASTPDDRPSATPGRSTRETDKPPSPTPTKSGQSLRSRC